MKIKKIISLGLAILLLFSSSPATFATNHTNNLGNSNNLYILSKPCPEEYKEYAKEMAGYMLWDYNISNPILGNPFTFFNDDSNIYYFPIYSNGEISLTFRIYAGHDGSPTGVVSPVFASALNTFASKTSLSDPLKVVYENKGDHAAVVFKLNNYEQEVQVTPIIRDIVDISPNLLNEEFEIVNCIQSETINLMPKARTSKTLSLSITEVQGSDNWCLAYCVAILMRYRGLNTTAQKIMTNIYGDDVTKQQALDRTDAEDYLHSYGFNTLKSDYWPTASETYLKIESEIDNFRPVILNMVKKPDKKWSHAIVARGYENVKATVSVWNPFYTYFETVVSLDNYSPAESSTVYFIGEYWYNNYR